MSNILELHDNPPNEPPVRGFLHFPTEVAGAPSADALVLTHGAGANSNAPLLVALAGAFCHSRWIVLRCDLPFRQSRPTGPPPPGSARRDQQGLKAAIAAMRRRTSGRVFLGGHSYGGRQSSMLAAAEPGLVDCLLLLSYPLHPPRRPSELRTAHFPRLQTPAMFVHGVRDPFGSIEELTAALALIPVHTELIAVPSAGHELLTRQNRGALPNEIVAAFRAFAFLRRPPRRLSDSQPG
jgi:predicted alpha/beta-hydrolase family hydrolase